MKRSFLNRSLMKDPFVAWSLMKGSFITVPVSRQRSAWA